MAEQVTKMVIKVDLQCHRCYKKIKKILCEIPQVKDRTFDEKKKTVTITVVGCCPEKVREKICCKGGNIILSIEIVPPPPPAPPRPPPSPPPPPPPRKVEVDVSGCVYVCPCRCHFSQFYVCECGCGRPPFCGCGCGRPFPGCTITGSDCETPCSIM